MNYLEPVFEKKFIFHSFACRKDKGAICAMKYLRYASKGTKSPIGDLVPELRLHYLQIDIKAFFMSLDKKILFEIIKKQIKNPEILWLAEKIIFHNPTKNFFKKGQLKLFDEVPKGKSLFTVPSGKGLPIGNLTSQFFANVYLNKLDQYAEHALKIKHYFRYVDDIVILHNSPMELKSWRKKIDEFLREILKLNLHPQKDVLRPVSQGINFLGYVIKPNAVLVRNRTVRKFKSLLWKWNLPPNPDFVNSEKSEKILPVINSYYGIFKHADTFRLRKHLYEKHFGILKEHFEPADLNYYYFRQTYVKNPKEPAKKQL